MARPRVQMDLGDDPPERTLRSVRRARVGRWWLEVKPVFDGRNGPSTTPTSGPVTGFQAVAHTFEGLPAVWAGPVRGAVGEATDDAIAVLGELRHHD